MSTSLTPEQRFARKYEVDPDSGCWNWTAGKDRHGYGKFTINYKEYRAHNVAYMWWGSDPFNGELQRDHLCSNKGCVNPDHLEQVTASVNTQRHHDKKTTCPRGHIRTGTMKQGDKRYKRCLVCHREREALRRSASKVGA